MIMIGCLGAGVSDVRASARLDGADGADGAQRRPVAADGDFKKLECSECRKTTKVLRGKASNLPKNFSLLR